MVNNINIKRKRATATLFQVKLLLIQVEITDRDLQIVQLEEEIWLQWRKQPNKLQKNKYRLNYQDIELQHYQKKKFKLRKKESNKVKIVFLFPLIIKEKFQHSLKVTLKVILL